VDSVANDIEIEMEPMPFKNEFLAQISDAVITVDKDMIVTYINPAAERQYELSAGEAVGKSLSEVHRNEWLDPAAEEAAMSALKELGYWRGYSIHTTRSGRRIHVESSVTRINDGNGSAGGMFAVIRDITERKAVETGLRVSEAKYRTLFESIGEGFCVLEMVFDEHGNAVDFVFRDVNPAFVRQTGMSNALGKTASEVVPELEDHWFEIYGGVAKTGVPARFQNEAAPLGRHYEVYAFRAGPPESRLVGVIFNDINERIRAEAAIRRSEEKFRTLFESIDEGFCIIEMIFDESGNPSDYRFLEVNPAFKRQTRIADAVGRRMLEIAPNHEQFWFDMYGKVARTDQGVRFEHEAKQLGSFYDVYAFRIGEPDEYKVGVLFNDVRERKRAEANERDKERLRALVRGQEVERQRLARDLHDDLGQQFTALRMKLNALRQASNGMDPAAIDEIQEMAERIDGAVDRLAWDLRPASLDDLGLQAALEQFVNEWSKYSGVAGEMLGHNMHGVRLPREIETNLYRVAQEAMHNALKHAEPVRVEVMLQRNDGFVRLVITDDGRGFDPKLIDRSTGLGFASMRERATLIGAVIDVETSPDNGTSVHVTVPISLATGTIDD
jgi:PAS domain S-box-containing protein